MQRAVNTIEEAVFCMWFACIHCWETDMFSMDPPRDYISRPVVNQKSNTSTVTLRVVGGDEKGSLESQTVKYGYESHGTRTRK
jgi:hypothetical protein